MKNSESEIEKFLGVPLEDLQWQDLAVCDGVRTNLFYDEYESDEMTATMVDQMCLSCPVMNACLTQGTQNGEFGVWGGVFLTAGKPDDKKNAHKTKDIWDELRGRISG